MIDLIYDSNYTFLPEEEINVKHLGSEDYDDDICPIRTMVTTICFSLTVLQYTPYFYLEIREANTISNSAKLIESSRRATTIFLLGGEKKVINKTPHSHNS